jgi:hypothetical protein
MTLRICGCLVLVVAVGAAGCSRPQPAASEDARTAAAPAPATLSRNTEDLLALLPAEGDAPGWSRTKEARRFGPGNLWDFIDGGAEQYLTYGFQELATAGYTHEPSRIEATLEIYRMADGVNAFGIYESEVNPAAEFLKVGVEGWRGRNNVSFWSGPYYVKLTALDGREQIKSDLQALAARVAGRIGKGGSDPTEVRYFPRQNLVPHSIKYVPKDVLGQSYLTNGFEAQYRNGKTALKLTLVSFDSPEAAAQGLARYRQFLSTSGEVSKDVKSPGEEGFLGKDSYFGLALAIRSGRNVLVALGASSEHSATVLVTLFLASMK